VDLNGASPEEVVIRVFPDVEVHGSVELPAGTKLLATDLSVELESRDPSEFGRFPGRGEVKADGSFTMEHVPAGTYDLEVESLPEGLFVKSLLQGRTDAFENGVRISSGVGVESITIVLSSMAGEISGTVHTEEGKAACGGKVILIPEQPGRFGQEDYPEDGISSSGHFSIRGIPPGVYKAFAFEDADEVAYRDSNEMKTYQSQGTAVQVAEGDKKLLDLTWIREVSGAH